MTETTTYTLWRERTGSNQWRLQTSDGDVCKALECDRHFRRTASAVTGGFFKVYRFQADNVREARRLIDKATRQVIQHNTKQGFKAVTG